MRPQRLLRFSSSPGHGAASTRRHGVGGRGRELRAKGEISAGDVEPDAVQPFSSRPRDLAGAQSSLCCCVSWSVSLSSL
ncbi:hypothetical protein FF1_022500 [Malus domestica]